MRTLFRVLPAIAAALLATITVAHASTGMPWRSSFAQAQIEAKSSKKLLMVDVYTDWCEWCKKLDTDVYTNVNVIAAAGQFVPVRVNAEKGGQDIATKYSVTGYPTILFLQPDGTLVGEIGGYEDAGQFTSDMSQVLQDNKDLPQLLAQINQQPNNVDVAVKLVNLYMRRSDGTDAKPLIAVIEQHGGAAQIVSAYTGLGDMDSAASHWQSAIGWYTKALISTDPQTLVAAHGGMANCYLQQGDKVNGKLELQKILVIPGIPSDLKDRVNQAIASM